MLFIEFIIEDICINGYNIIVSNMEMNDVSSTFIRDNIRKEDKVRKYLDEDVLRYIYENELYR